MENKPVNPVENAAETSAAEIVPAAAEAAPKKKRKLWLIPVCLIAVLLAAGGGLYAVFAGAVSDAEQQFASGNYAAARSFYEEMDFLPDSAAKVQECDYNIAKNFMRNSLYAEARESFLSMGDYLDCAELADECLYLSAEQLIADKDYTEAIEIYTQLGDYKDSAELKVKYGMDQVIQLYRDGKFEECMALAEQHYDLHEHAVLYYNLALLGTLRETGTDLDTLRQLGDAILPYQYKVTDASKALVHPQFHILRFIDAIWRSTDGDYLVFDSEEQVLYYELSWYTPEGEPWYASDDERLYFFTDAADEFWFSVDRFSDSSVLTAPWTMYVMDNEDHVHVFYNENFDPEA